MFFPVHTLLENRLGLCDSLRTDFYRYPALQPSVGDGPIASMPTELSVEEVAADNEYYEMLKWKQPDDARYCVVYAFPTNSSIDFEDPQFIVGISENGLMKLSFDPYKCTICVTSVNRYHRESLPAILR